MTAAEMNAASGSTGSTDDGLRLGVIEGKAAGFTIAVGDRLMIGRHSDGPGRLADDPELSRHHAEISRQPSGEYVIRDLSSTNGTFVNGARVTPSATLVTGDRIEVGSTTLVVREAPGSAGAAGVDVRASTVTVDVPEALRSAPPPGPPGAESAPEVEEPEPAGAETERYDSASEPAVTESEPAVTESEPIEPEQPAATPPLELRLIIDLENAETRIELPGDAEPIRLHLEDGRWRARRGDEQ